MTFKNFLLLTLVVAVIFLFGCTQSQPTQREYVCSNGQVVLDSANCPKEEIETSFCNVEQKSGSELESEYGYDLESEQIYYRCSDSDDNDDPVWENTWTFDRDCKLWVNGLPQQLYNVELYCDNQNRCQKKDILLKDCRDFGARPADTDARCQASEIDKSKWGCTFWGPESAAQSDGVCTSYCRGKSSICIGKVFQFPHLSEPSCQCDCIY